MENRTLIIIILIVSACQLQAGDDEMALIPGGEFEMGRKPAAGATYVDNPTRRVKVDAFYMDRYEVTNAQYLEFCQATDHKLPEFWGIFPLAV